MKRGSLASVSKAAKDATVASKVRDEKIKAAYAEGHTLRAIAEAAGLSFARIHQIVGPSRDVSGYYNPTTGEPEAL